MEITAQRMELHCFRWNILSTRGFLRLDDNDISDTFSPLCLIQT
jgi:hypothetical protein